MEVLIFVVVVIVIARYLYLKARKYNHQMSLYKKAQEASNELYDLAEKNFKLPRYLAEKEDVIKFRSMHLSAISKIDKKYSGNRQSFRIEKDEKDVIEKLKYKNECWRLHSESE